MSDYHAKTKLDKVEEELKQVKLERDRWRGVAQTMADHDSWIAEEIAGLWEDDEGGWNLP